MLVKLPHNLVLFCSKGDQERVDLQGAAMAFVLPDTVTPTPETEDLENIVRAVAIATAVPTLNVKVMVIRPRNARIALDAGLSPHCCYSLNFIKVNSTTLIMLRFI